MQLRLLPGDIPISGPDVCPRQAREWLHNLLREVPSQQEKFVKTPENKQEVAVLMTLQQMDSKLILEEREDSRSKVALKKAERTVAG